MKVEALERRIRPFDIVLLAHGEPTPEIGQPENVPVVESITPFREIPSMMKPNGVIQLAKHFQVGEDLLGLRGDNGDRISHDELLTSESRGSLALFLVSKPQIYWKQSTSQWRMKFEFGGRRHDLKVTDIAWPIEETPPGDWIVCVSRTGQPFHSDHFGVIAMATPIAQLPSHVSAKCKAGVIELVSILREWRLAISKRDKVPAYVVMGNDTLEAIVDARPSTIAELSRVKGIGAKRLEKYGEDLLDLLGR
jgi:hypothetical protein